MLCIVTVGALWGVGLSLAFQLTTTDIQLRREDDVEGVPMTKSQDLEGNGLWLCDSGRRLLCVYIAVCFSLVETMRAGR